MDANGSRYHALISEGDWTDCLPAADGDPGFAWRNGALVLRPLLFEFRSGVGTNAPLTEESGRGGVFDAYGNLYSLAPDRHSVRIRSAGSGVDSDFWPVSGATAPSLTTSWAWTADAPRPSTARATRLCFMGFPPLD